MRRSIVLVNETPPAPLKLSRRLWRSTTGPGGGPDHIRQRTGAERNAAHEKCGLALTTAQYFTSSGRSIQRPMPGTALATRIAPAPSPAAARLWACNRRPWSPAQPRIPHRHRQAGCGGRRNCSRRAIREPRARPLGRIRDQRGFFTSYASEYLTLHGRVNESFQPDGKTWKISGTSSHGS